MFLLSFSFCYSTSDASTSSLLTLSESPDSHSPRKYCCSGYCVQFWQVYTISQILQQLWILVVKEYNWDVVRNSFIMEALRHVWVVWMCFVLICACCRWYLLYNNNAMYSLPSLPIISTSCTKSVTDDGLHIK